MSDRRLFSAFYLPMAARPPAPGTLEGIAGRAGMIEQVSPSWQPEGQPITLGSWGGIDCESHFLPLKYYDSLIFTFREDEFLAIRSKSSGEAPHEDGAARIINAFQNACTALSPAFAAISTYAWPDPFWQVANQEEDILSGNVGKLSREGFGALYFTSEDAQALRRIDSLADRESLALDDGVIFFRGSGLNRW